MVVENMNYEFENPGNIRSRLLLYSELVKKAEEKRKEAEEKQEEKEE